MAEGAAEALDLAVVAGGGEVDAVGVEKARRSWSVSIIRDTPHERVVSTTEFVSPERKPIYRPTMSTRPLRTCSDRGNVVPWYVQHTARDHGSTLSELPPPQPEHRHATDLCVHCTETGRRLLTYSAVVAASA